MDDWHASSCRKPDILAGEGFVSCQKCGSFGVTAQTTTPETGDDSSATSRPIYEPLKEKTDIRLLKVEPGDFEDPIQCSLSLSSTTSRAEYEAISYTWGGEDNNMEKMGRIRLGEKPFYVTVNCESALRHTRSKYNSKVIWIDAICTNQDDMNERGHQVRVMPQIYSGARQVLVYVGEAGPLDDKLFNFLSGKRDDCVMYKQLQFTLAKLLRRRYFSRVWILQEIALARKAVVICGRNTLPWSSMQPPRLVDLGLLSRDATPLPKNTLLPPALSFRAPVYRDSSELLGLLDLARNSQATDPRDKVFALYGLILFPKHDGLMADYTRSTKDVFIDVATWIAKNFGITMLLARTTNATPMRPETMRMDMHMWDSSSLPTWVPDWTKPITPNTYTLTSRLLGYDENSCLMHPKVNPARATPFIEVLRDNIMFPALKLGSICDEFVELQRKLNMPGSSELTVPWNFLELLTVQDGSHNWRQVKIKHILKTNSEICRQYLVYLIPEPADYGHFLFKEPGPVSVRIERGGFTWTHEDCKGVNTTGFFEEHAVCFLKNGTETVRGLLRMNHAGFNGFWRTGQFETIRLVGGRSSPSLDGSWSGLAGGASNGHLPIS